MTQLPAADRSPRYDLDQMQDDTEFLDEIENMSIDVPAPPTPPRARHHEIDDYSILANPIKPKTEQERAQRRRIREERIAEYKRREQNENRLLRRLNRHKRANSIGRLASDSEPTFVSRSQSTPGHLEKYRKRVHFSLHDTALGEDT
ncbi:hypothetical protein CANCADRAFT_128720 [Tortispora caseinolytica NRRL Y-17796]|uniref:Uncharacterized protein n=1 Tax=Tortispora caseinolytica NRRL Y-17796 TaxID=767744 RepID=A0A1E4TAI7_9ASCO|nr:hypothetical protein CANCADRAFT_128720 [Tortispora caseinolytica NRRL Y-17796]